MADRRTPLAPAVDRPDPRGAALSWLFAVSGAAALVLEVVWTRWLVLSLGASSLAATVVLAVFMGGLGAGSFLAGRFADRHPDRAVVLFASAEALVGAWSFLSILLLGRWLPGLAAAIARAFDAPALPLPLRVALAALALAPPTLLMGATLPLLARWAGTAGMLPGKGTGTLYTLNTLGGMAGALLATFVLIDRLGLAGSAAIAGAADLSVAAAAFLLFRGVAQGEKRGAPRREAPRPAIPAVPAAAPTSERAIFAAVAAAYFVSGFVGLGLEVVSHRILAILAGSSVYAFTVMLAAFLAGIAGGSALASRWADRVREPLAWVGLTLGGLALGTGFAQRCFDAGGWSAAGRAAAAVPGLGGGSYGFELGGCFATLLPATLMLGAMLPFVARASGSVPDRFAGRFGGAYALNTAGAVLGAVAAGWILVPALGTGLSLSLLTLLAGAAGTLAVLAAVPRSSRAVPAAVAAGLTAVGLALGWGADPVKTALNQQVERSPLLAFREGPVQTLAVIREENDLQLGFLRMIANQTSLTGTHLYSRRYMTLLSHLPALWGPVPKRALVICFGTGITAGAAAAYPTLDRLDIAEISPEVIEVSPLFREENGNVLADPRVRLHVEDGRQVLLASRDPWDFVTLEPPPPRDSGVVSLYSSDFYRLCRRRLTPGGVVAQWIPLLSQSRDEIRMLVRTFVDAFPHTLGFLPVERDLILLGSGRPLVIDPAETARRMADPAVRRSLAEIGFDEPADLLAAAVADRASLARFAGDAETVSDDRPRVEVFARYGKRAPRPDVSALVKSLPLLGELASPEPPPAARIRFETARGALLASLGGGWAREARRGADWESLSVRAIRLRPEDPYYLWAAGLSDEHLRRMAERAGRAVQAGRGKEGAEAWTSLGMLCARRGRYDGAIDAYRKAFALTPSSTDLLFNLGMLLDGPGGKPDEGKEMLRRFLELAPSDPAAGAARQRLASPEPG